MKLEGAVAVAASLVLSGASPAAFAAPPPGAGNPHTTSAAATTTSAPAPTATAPQKTVPQKTTSSPARTSPDKPAANPAPSAAPQAPKSTEPAAKNTVDRARPAVLALHSSGRSGHAVRLRFIAVDDTGISQYTARVLAVGAVVATFVSAVASAQGRASYLTWNAPRGLRGTFRFCIAARDRAGHRAEGCSVLVLRR